MCDDCGGCVCVMIVGECVCEGECVCNDGGNVCAKVVG